MGQRVESSAVVGCVIGLLQRGSEPEYWFHGKCTSGGKAISSNVLWEAASLSKPVVALLAAEQLVRDPGLLTRRLSTDLRAFDTTDDERWGEVNLQHLLTHSAGLPNWRDEGRRLDFESSPSTPGYSGEGFELLLSELSIHSALGSNLLLDRHLAKLQMTHSTFMPRPGIATAVAIGHDACGQPVPKRLPTSPKASGSLHATAADYMRFLRIIARPDDVRNIELREAAQRVSDRQLTIVAGHGRTLGWAFTESDEGDVLWQHGDNPGYKHIAAVRPSTAEAILVFTNDDGGQSLYRDLCADFLGVEVW